MIKEVLSDAEHRMGKAVEALHHHLASVRTGRANPSLLDRIVVDYYGTPTPVNQLAGISVPESRMLVIQPWDKGSMAAIEKAIMKSDLGITPSNDGQVIRLGIPPLTEERRKQMVKQVHALVEEGKVSVRNVRRDALASAKELAGDKLVSEDEERRASTQVDEMTKRFVDEIERVGKAKEAEVLEV